MSFTRKAVITLLAFSLVTGGCAAEKTPVQNAAVRPKSKPPAAQQKARPVVAQTNRYVEQIDVLKAGVAIDSLNGGIFVSPDGRLAAFSGSRVPRGEVPKGKEVEFEARLVLADLVGGTVKLLDRAEYISILEWSPAGDKILYRRGDSTSDCLCIADVSGSEPMKIADRAYCGSISPDGTRVAYAVRGKGIFTSGIDGSSPQKLTGGDNDWYPVWYPDGKSLLYFAGKNAGSGEEDTRLQGMARIYTRSSRRKNLVPGLTGRFRRAAWIVPGKVVYVTKQTDTGFSGLIVDLAAGRVKDPGIREPGPDSPLPVNRAKGYVYKAEAGIVAVYDKTGRETVSVVPGKSQPFNDADFSVAPDGRMLAYLSVKEGEPPGTGDRHCRIIVTGLDGGKPRQVSDYGHFARPVWTPDGNRVVTVETGGDSDSGKFTIRIIPRGGKV